MRSVLALCLLAVPLHAQDQWDRADLQTRRIPPSAYQELPAAVRADLNRRGCTVPQPWPDTVAANVVRGHFRSPRATDWVVLCSIDRVSRILVYWTGRADSVAELASVADKNYLQGVGGDSIAFSRAIDAVDPTFIRQHAEWYGGSLPSPLDHDGISDAFVGKASVVWYWHQGKWLKLTGAN